MVERKEQWPLESKVALGLLGIDTKEECISIMGEEGWSVLMSEAEKEMRRDDQAQNNNFIFKERCIHIRRVILTEIEKQLRELNLDLPAGRVDPENPFYENSPLGDYREELLSVKRNLALLQREDRGLIRAGAREM